MTKFSRSELIEIAKIYLLANTPLSLLKGLRASGAMHKLMHSWEMDELVPCYDHLTAKPRQTEISVALCYSLLIAAILRGQGGLDTSRLHWGEFLQQYLKQSGTNSSYLELTSPPQGAPQSIVQSNTRSSTVIYGSDDRPIDLAERFRQ